MFAEVSSSSQLESERKMELVSGTSLVARERPWDLQEKAGFNLGDHDDDDFGHRIARIRC